MFPSLPFPRFNMITPRKIRPLPLRFSDSRDITLNEIILKRRMFSFFHFSAPIEGEQLMVKQIGIKQAGIYKSKRTRNAQVVLLSTETIKSR